MPSSVDPDGLLFEQMRPRLVAISRRIVGSEAEAEDIVQDCFLKWHHAEGAALQTPAAWLTTVVQHRSIDRLRKRARDAASAIAAHELAAHAPPDLPDAPLLERADVGEAYARLLARLSPSERLALVLREVFDCAHADIAAVLGTVPANARQHLARARRRLQLDKEEKEEGRREEQRCRELVRRFHEAIRAMDVPALTVLLGDEQPVSVHEGSRVRGGGGSANDAFYCLSLRA